MQQKIILLAIIVLIGMSSNYAYSQEIRLATFQETAQIIVDQRMSQNVTASITLQSTSVQEIKIPAELEQRIRENGNISAVIITNQNECVLGVHEESCIIINVKRDPADKNFLTIQNSTLRISEQFIDEINEIFDTKAELHSTFIRPSDNMNLALETSGVISGKGTISAVYIMPMEDTDSMYEKISAILIPKTIRDSGGFYDAARNLSTDENAKMTFSIIPSENKSLLQLRLSTDYSGIASNIDKIKPLEFLKTGELHRSDYFSTGFYPLNSIIQVVVLSAKDTNVSDVKGNISPTQIIDGEKIPTDITKQGWIFDPEEGQTIQGKYIFGEKTSVTNKELEFSLGGKNIQSEKQEFDDSIPIVIIIAIIAIAAAMFYLKGYKKQSQ
ncbi:MAG: hypothetical protein OPY06_01120 [Nitrosopumilus sp.]|nr:hypothetical protein [Nitrosopumilus sp.]MDF2422912.1 hypothetical protein [Nitrosopumilus sp.]MDF2424696.1 hypothetical protein [Nitrosopumilus sp.]MDF2424852.1 hypothetical protein [Nitrosopumilus sp.]MDF2427203.1 hypothetical protein [Nitrosopumilus sp.]